MTELSPAVARRVADLNQTEMSDQVDISFCPLARVMSTQNHAIVLERQEQG